MAELTHTRFLLPERSYQAIVRSDLKKMAESAGFSGHRLGEVEILIAELTSNLLKHAAKGGEILARITKKPAEGIEFISIDHGPGMRWPAHMIEDGVSTTKTLGQGLGAIQRISNVFHLYSIDGWGTILYAQACLDKKCIPTYKDLETGFISTPKKTEKICGDLCTVTRHDNKYRIMMIDGLGHGPEANKAARIATDAFEKYPQDSPAEQLKDLNEKLRHSRGGVVTVVDLGIDSHRLRYAGVGNISMRIISHARSHGCLPYNGIVGHNMPSHLEDHVVPMESQQEILIMHSDGLSARWDLSKYPGIRQHPMIILCAALYKDHNRDNDDSTILVVKFIK